MVNMWCFRIIESEGHRVEPEGGTEGQYVSGQELRSMGKVCGGIRDCIGVSGVSTKKDQSGFGVLLVSLFYVLA